MDEFRKKWAEYERTVKEINKVTTKISHESHAALDDTISRAVADYQGLPWYKKVFNSNPAENLNQVIEWNDQRIRIDRQRRMQTIYPTMGGFMEWLKHNDKKT